MNKSIFARICAIFSIIFCVCFTPNVLANPQTGDAVTIYFALLLISLMGVLIFAKLELKETRLFC